MGFFCSKAAKISLQPISSTSLPCGALAMYLTSVTCKSSFKMRSPPLSPSKNAVASFSLHICIIVSGTFAPSKAMTSVIPHFARFITSALPSTIVSILAFSMPGVAVNSSGPYCITFVGLRVSETSLKTSSVLGKVSMFHLCSICLALSTIIFRRVSRISSIFSSVTLAWHGPTRFMLSRLAAIMAVLTPQRTRDGASGGATI